MLSRAQRKTATRSLSMLTLAALLGAAGCRTPWYKQDQKSDIVRTDMTFRSEPAGAAISFDGKHLGTAPVLLPIEYDHTIELWARAGNPGADLREATGVVGTVLLLPIWLILSIPQRRDEMRRNVYGGNVHRVSATFDDATTVEETITLDGHETLELTLRR